MASLYVIIEYTRPLQGKMGGAALCFFGEPEKNTCIDLEGLPIVGNWVLESTR